MTHSINTSLATALFLCLFFAPLQDINNAPKVTISLNQQGSTFRWNSIVPYTISVSDVEDGNTEYNEIPSNEVLLVGKYLPDSALLKEKAFEEEMSSHHDTVLALSKALCFSCHAAKAKLIGPSFEQVAARYKNADGAVDQLTKRIIDGSTGIWSDLKMPPHPDLKVSDLKEMVTWILKNNSDPDLIYFVGTEGSFKTKEKPANTSPAGVYILTASYNDHGLKKTTPGMDVQGKRSQYTLVLKAPK